MPARLRRLALAVPFAVALLAFVGLATTSAGGFSYDTYFKSAYERQIDNRTCVAASTAMMLNIMNGSDMNWNQMTILKYAQAHDGQTQGRGSDPLGWAMAASYYSQNTIRPTTYKWEAYNSEAYALKRAAIQITRTGKAVGMLVAHGNHAVVMNGFTSTRNPLDGSFRVTGIWVSDPIGASNKYYSAAGSPLNTYRQLDGSPSYDKAWYGKYIIIVPRN